MSEFHDKLRAAAAELRYLEKEGYNEHFKYSFVSESQVKRAVSPVLEKHGLVISQVDYQALGTITPQAAVLSCTVFITDNGCYSASFHGIGAGTDKGDKAPMKACAAALKYALTSGFLIATGDDPEADTETDRSEAAKPKPAPKKEPSKEAPKSDVPTGTKSTNLALKATMLISAAETVEALNALATEQLASMKGSLATEDYETLLKAFRERKAQLTKEGTEKV